MLADSFKKFLVTSDNTDSLTLSSLASSKPGVHTISYVKICAIETSLVFSSTSPAAREDTNNG